MSGEAPAKKGRILSVVLLGTGLLSGCGAWRSASSIGPTPPKPVARGQPVPAAPETPVSYQPFVIFSSHDTAHNHYVASGYMGDGTLTLSGAYVPVHQGTGPCLRVAYRSGGQMGWSGVYWQQPANNWADIPGNAGYDLRGAARLSFWARGEKGGEKVHEFRVGGIVGRYPDSDAATIGPITLPADWKRYEIDLSRKDLRHIIGGFGFFVNKFENPQGSVFYLDDIAFEFPSNVPLPKTPPPVAVTPPAPVAAAPLAPPPVAPKDLNIKPDQAGLRVSFSSQLLFASGKSDLLPNSRGILNQLIDVLKAYPKNDVLVEGHTDSTGNADFNLNLSRLRAESVRSYLIRQGGFEAKRFRTLGFGDTQPVGDNKTAAGRALNRRVELIILKVPEKP